MCTSPIKMYNPKIALHANNDKIVLDVPCGHCDECTTNKIMGYQIRAYYEYKSTIEKGGCAYYYTLTYNNKHLPKIQFDSRFYNRSYSFSCFRKSDIDNFRRKFKQYAKDPQHLIFKPYDGEIKFFITSEYGGNTRRPHYHLIVFFSKQITPKFVEYLFQKSWTVGTKLFQSESLGFYKAGADDGLLNSYAGVLYVCKYVCKSESFLDVEKKIKNAYVNTRQYLDYSKKLQKYHCNKYRMILDNHEVVVNADDEPKDEYFENLRKQYVCQFYKSRNFGVAAFDYMTDIQSKLGVIKFPDSKNGFGCFPLPLYLIRKLYYNTVNYYGQIRYELNEKGVERKVSLLEKLIDKKTQNVLSWKTLGDVEKPLYDALCHYTGINLPDYHHIVNYLCDLLPDNNFRNLYVYDLVYKGRAFDNFNLVNYSNNFKKFISADETLPFDYPPVKDKDRVLLFDNIPAFKNFNHALFVIKLCQSYQSFKRYLKRCDKMVSSSRLKFSLSPDNEHKKNKFNSPKTLEQFSNLFVYD